MFSVTRREFMLQSAAGAASLGLFLNGKRVHLEAAPLPRPASPNDRVNVGFIGYGIRGCFLMECVKQTEQANLIAVADCYRGISTAPKNAPRAKSKPILRSIRSCLKEKTWMP